MAYRVFHRTWWARNPEWPDGREPCPGKKHFFGRTDIYISEAEARQVCKAWNASHDPGFLSDKAEYEDTLI